MTDSDPDWAVGDPVTYAGPNAFLTGSQVYGTPRPDSDIDLVVLLDWREFDKLAELTESAKGGSNPSEHGITLTFGKLNLIAMSDNRIFEAWHAATEILKKVRPATREQAIVCIDREIAIRLKGIE